MSTMFNNPFYLGLIRIKKTGETFPGIHEPLVSKMLFEQVQSVLQGKAVKKLKQHEFLFRGLLVCRGCGNRLSGEVQKGHTYYRCHTRSCATRCVRQELVTVAIENALQPLRFSQKELQILVSMASELNLDWANERQKHMQNLRLQRDALTRRIARLTDVYVEGGLDKPLFEERKEALLVERLDMEERIRGLENGTGVGKDKLRLFLELAGNAYLSYKTAPLSLKREIIENVTSNRIVYGKNVLVKLNLPYSELAERPKFVNGRAYRDTARTFLTRLSEILVRMPLGSSEKVSADESDAA